MSVSEKFKEAIQARGPSRPPGFLRAWVLGIAAVVAYASAIPGKFVWVDHVEIEKGGYRLKRANELGRLWGSSLDEYIHRESGVVRSVGGYWRPAYGMSLTLDWMLWRDRPAWYHFENLLWHVAVVLLLYAFGTRALGARAHGMAVFWATLLFAVHPLGTHSVSWISGRKDLMCAAFGLGALLALMTAGESRRKAWLWLTVGFALAFLAMASKELALALPVVAAPWLYWHVRRLAHERNPDTPDIIDRLLRFGWRQTGVAVGGLMALALVILLFRRVVLGGIGLNVGYPSESFGGNLAMSAKLAWHYLGLILLPRWPSISDAWPLQSGMDLFGAVSCLLLLVVLGLIVRGWLRREAWSLAAMWYVGWMLPAFGFLPLRHFRAERYLYPASWGLLLAVLLLIFPLLKKQPKVRWAIERFVLPGVAVALLVLTSSSSHQMWSSDDALFTNASESDPHHVEAFTALAALRLEDEEYGKSIDRSIQALKIVDQKTHTGYWSPRVTFTNFGLALFRLRQHEAALVQLERARQVAPEDAITHYHVGLVALAKNDRELALSALKKSLEINPRDRMTRSNYALTLLRMGQIDEAVERLRTLVFEDADDMINVNNLVIGLLALEQFDEAKIYAQRLVDHDPKNAVHRARLAWCQWRTGERADAVVELQRALLEAPDHRVVKAIADVSGIELNPTEPKQ